jgi:hypothetical protein
LKSNFLGVKTAAKLCQYLSRLATVKAVECALFSEGVHVNPTCFQECIFKVIIPVLPAGSWKLLQGGMFHIVAGKARLVDHERNSMSGHQTWCL